MAAACVAWAFWPLRAAVLPSSLKPLAPSSAMTPRKANPLELAAFRAPLWVAPPPPPAPPTPSAPPPPLKLQLIAIIAGPNDGSSSDLDRTRAALLYDPDQDKLITVHQGETLNGRTIERITENDVRIRDGAGARTLALRADGPAGGSRP